MIDRFKGEYRWLSNFWAAPVMLDGLLYPTTEHAYQASKTDDPHIRDKIRCLPTAGKAKQFGKRIGRSIPYRPAWSDDFKTEVMRRLLTQKFTDPALRQRLMNTGDELLVELGHWHDLFWGRCRCPRCGGRGRNMLGVLLMELRDRCCREDTSTPVLENERLRDAA